MPRCHRTPIVSRDSTIRRACLVTRHAANSMPRRVNSSARHHRLNEPCVHARETPRVSACEFPQKCAGDRATGTQPAQDRLARSAAGRERGIGVQRVAAAAEPVEQGLLRADPQRRLADGLGALAPADVAARVAHQHGLAKCAHRTFLVLSNARGRRHCRHLSRVLQPPLGSQPSLWMRVVAGRRAGVWVSVPCP